MVFGFAANAKENVRNHKWREGDKEIGGGGRERGRQGNTVSYSWMLKRGLRISQAIVTFHRSKSGYYQVITKQVKLDKLTLVGQNLLHTI
jgi:hypothetical protein